MRKNRFLREAKEDERLPEGKAERTEGESAFQREGPILLRQKIETEPKLFCYVEI